MLAAAALSATIGALVSGGFVLLRGPAAGPHPLAASTATAAHPSVPAPCPINVPSTTAGSALVSHPSMTNSAVLSAPASTSFASSTLTHGAAPLQVSVDNLPLETSSGKLVEPAATHAAVASHGVAHVTTVAAPRATAERVVVAPAERAPTAAERKRAKSEALAAHTVQNSTDDDDAPEAAAAPLPPPPVPTKGPDRAAIAKAVSHASGAAKSCDAGPRSGRASITFAPSGNVQSVQLIESFGDSAVNGCVLRALGRAHVPPFAGGLVEVRKGLSW